VVCSSLPFSVTGRHEQARVSSSSLPPNMQRHAAMLFWGSGKFDAACGKAGQFAMKPGFSVYLNHIRSILHLLLIGAEVSAGDCAPES
jgi:hypothetical protein